ncbi:hypothetical protein BBO99_00000781 [Phytophthora kernoviae]|uniref:Uncharacterized protein n=2 Tax=Phytophthora kernoviae TaxID=325452 RepID=A0A3R7H2R7_9STRA|nr:hypothetical protein G195_008953 [Phytophthora kernoviae 00238/432]KAG2515072.1 hypothetical protein JM18_008241 [Phytophthora kernoviae]KAG2527699.1 hypothetical protein JM16_001531 [Phytophthora kernoviae]RLN46761.1 hypothetical protein BBI17_000655 [Phytophthora kernoviae]RLN85104.1 hypothetical protein BBO99_00000781 [Phytophthora kernoviae]
MKDKQRAESLKKCDEKIAQASNHLEELLQSAEDDVLGARFGAAQVRHAGPSPKKIISPNLVPFFHH